MSEFFSTNSPCSVVDLQSYPANVFSFLMTFGLFFVRKRRSSIDAPPTEFRAWNAVIVFSLAVNIYLLVLPWVPPDAGIYGGDVSFFYATYCIVGLAMWVTFPPSGYTIDGVLLASLSRGWPMLSWSKFCQRSTIMLSAKGSRNYLMEHKLHGWWKFQIVNFLNGTRPTTSMVSLKRENLRVTKEATRRRGSKAESGSTIMRALTTIVWDIISISIWTA